MRRDGLILPWCQKGRLQLEFRSIWESGRQARNRWTGSFKSSLPHLLPHAIDFMCRQRLDVLGAAGTGPWTGRVCTKVGQLKLGNGTGHNVRVSVSSSPWKDSWFFQEIPSRIFGLIFAPNAKNLPQLVFWHRASDRERERERESFYLREREREHLFKRETEHLCLRQLIHGIGGGPR